MKYILAAVLISSVFVLRADAFSWDELVSRPVNSLKSFFAASAGKETVAAAKEEKASALPQDLPPAEAKAYLESDRPALLDVRTPDEYAAGHLESAVLTDYYAPDFKDKLNKLDKTAKYLIYCRTGKRSAAALKIMQELGFSDARDIAGGITAWTAAGYPVVK